MSHLDSNLAHSIGSTPACPGAKLSPRDSELYQALSRDDLALFMRGNPQASKDGRSILITASDQGGYVAIEPLVKYLINSKECASLSLLVCGVALENTLSRLPGVLPRVSCEGETTKRNLALLSTIKQSRPDIVISSVESHPGPESIVLLDRERLMSGGKVYLMLEAYQTLGGCFGRCPGEIDTACIDGILCNDELSKEVAHEHLPNYPKEKLYVTGTGQSDALISSNAKRYDFRATGSKKLNLSGEDFVCLFLGDLSGYPSPVDPNINETTWSLALEALVRVARTNPDLELAVLLRPHPSDKRSNEMFSEMRKFSLPANLKFRAARKEFVGLEEALYTADCIMGIGCTETYKATFRDIPALFLAFDNPGLGGTLLATQLTRATVEAFRHCAGLAVIQSPTVLQDAIVSLASGSEESALFGKTLAGQPDLNQTSPSNIAKIILAR